VSKSLWILNHYAGPPEITGGVRHYKISKKLIKKGYKVKIFAASSIHNSKDNIIKDKKKYLYKEFDNVPFIFIKARNYSGNGKERILNMLDYSIGLLSITKIFHNEKPDIVIASSVHPLTWLSGYQLAKRYNAKFIVETRDLWPETLITMGRLKKNSIITKIMYRLEKYIYKKGFRLIFTFPGGKDYVESIGLDSSKVRYINNGVDLEEFNRNKFQYKYVDKELNKDKAFNVIYTGSMGIANSLHYLIKSAEIIQQRGIKDIQFILFGDGYLKQKLEKYIRDNNINNVVFKGRVEKKYIPYILSKSHLNIFTGKSSYLYKYGLSLNKMFDYFASGKPTVSNIECGYNLLEKYKCGITVKGNSAEALAEGILKFYYMPKEEYNLYCNNALKAAQDFDYEILAEQFEKVILED
jgi:glycosyltransferase involved in cell wall biosynthesis